MHLITATGGCALILIKVAGPFLCKADGWSGDDTDGGMKKIIIGLAATAVIMIGVFRGAGWYADHSALPRYCANPDGVLRIVGDIMAGRMDGYSDNKHDYIVSSKLLFLVPREDGESSPVYMARLKQRILESCP